MECQTAQSNTLCTNGYYGFQPVLNGDVAVCQQDAGVTSLSNGANGHGEWNGGLSPVAWQRKRSREDAVYGNGDAPLHAGETRHSGTTAKRLCPDLYHAKLQQAMGVSFNNGMESVSIGTDSVMMMTDECGEMETSSCPMSTVNGVENVHTNGLTNSSSSSVPPVTTVGASRMTAHTCCNSRAQLCTMSFQQSYVLSSSQDCPRCMAGEPAPYLSIQQTVENLSKLY